MFARVRVRRRRNLVGSLALAGVLGIGAGAAGVAHGYQQLGTSLSGKSVSWTASVRGGSEGSSMWAQQAANSVSLNNATSTVIGSSPSAARPIKKDDAARGSHNKEQHANSI
jgi:hypothetical protein